MPLHCHAPPTPQRASAEFGVRPASPSPVVPALLCKQSFLLKSQCLWYHHHVGFSGRGSSWSLVLPPKKSQPLGSWPRSPVWMLSACASASGFVSSFLPSPSQLSKRPWGSTWARGVHSLRPSPAFQLGLLCSDPASRMIFPNAVSPHFFPAENPSGALPASQ